MRWKMKAMIMDMCVLSHKTQCFLMFGHVVGTGAGKLRGFTVALLLGFSYDSVKQFSLMVECFANGHWLFLPPPPTGGKKTSCGNQNGRKPTCPIRNWTIEQLDSFFPCLPKDTKRFYCSQFKEPLNFGVQSRSEFFINCRLFSASEEPHQNLNGIFYHRFSRSSCIFGRVFFGMF